MDNVNLALVVAVSKNGVIGNNGDLPDWNLKTDMTRFRNLTRGHPVVMGRKTHESIGRPLPNRRNLVLSRDRGYISEGCDVFHRWSDILTTVGGEKEVFIIGGTAIYQLALQTAQTIHLTIVHGEFEGDTFFPRLDENQWEEVDSEFVRADEHNSHDCTFITLRRKEQ